MNISHTIFMLFFFFSRKQPGNTRISWRGFLPRNLNILKDHTSKENNEKVFSHVKQQQKTTEKKEKQGRWL